MPFVKPVGLSICKREQACSMRFWLWLKNVWRKKGRKIKASWVGFLLLFFSGQRLECTPSFQPKLRSYVLFLFLWWAKVKAAMTPGGVDKCTQQRAPVADYLSQLCWSSVPLRWYVGVRNPSSPNWEALCSIITWEPELQFITVFLFFLNQNLSLSLLGWMDKVQSPWCGGIHLLPTQQRFPPIFRPIRELLRGMMDVRASKCSAGFTEFAAHFAPLSFFLWSRTKHRFTPHY